MQQRRGQRAQRHQSEQNERRRGREKPEEYDEEEGIAAANCMRPRPFKLQRAGAALTATDESVKRRNVLVCFIVNAKSEPDFGR